MYVYVASPDCTGAYLASEHSPTPGLVEAGLAG